MSAMYRLKAYFGMVPDDEMGEYADEYEPVYGTARSGGGRRDERSVRDLDEGWDERSDRRWVDDERSWNEDQWERRQVRGSRSERPVTTVRDHVRAGGHAGIGLGGGGGAPAVRGALAIDPDVVHEREFTQREALSREFSGPVSAGPAPTSVPEQRDPAGTRATTSPARIVTLHPRSYTEARAIGERFRDGVPVIMNLTELDAASAKRLVDFAAGLVFALRGGFDKVTNRVFLLTPANTEVSADDARKLASRSTGDR